MRRTFLFAAVACCAASAQRICNALDYGAIGDGVHDDTAAITAAINACADGGSVLIPPTAASTAPAVYLITSISVNVSNVVITLPAGGTLLASSNASAFPIVAGLPSYFPAYWRYAPVLWLAHCVNVTLTGGGLIDGAGRAWWDAYLNGQFVDPLNMHRPYLLEMFHASNVTLSCLSLRNSPFWSVHPVYSDHIVIDHVDIFNPVGSANADGIDPDSSSYVSITNSVIANGDDCIAIKSGRGPAGQAFGMASHHIYVNNVTLNHGLGVTIGAEAAGGVHDVLVTNLTARNTLTAAHVQSVRYHDPTWCAGGIVENITFDTLAVQNVHYAVYFNMFWGDIEGSGNGPFPSNVSPPPARNATTPTMRNITVRNVVGLGVLDPVHPSIDAYMTGNLQCIPEMPCTGITLENFNLLSYKSWACANIDNATLTVSNVYPPVGQGNCFNSIAVPAYHASAFQ